MTIFTTPRDIARAINNLEPLTVRGISTTPAGYERFTRCTIGRRARIQYDYRTPEGVLFSCVKTTLDECRDARDAWILTRGE